MRSFLMSILAALAAIVLPVHAHADDGRKSATPPAVATDDPDEPPRDRLEGRFDTSFVSGSFPHLTVRRADIGAGLMYFPGGLPIALGTGIHFGPSFLELDGPLAEGFGMDASLAHWTNLSLEAQAELTVYRGKRLSFDLYGGFEMSAFDDRLIFSHGDLATGQGTFDITPFLNDHLVLRYGWSRMDAGVTARYRLGAFTPRVGVGFRRLLLRVSAEANDEGRFILAHLGDATRGIEQLYEEDFTAIRLAPGVDWRTSRTLALSLDVYLMPTADATFFGGILGTHVTF